MIFSLRFVHFIAGLALMAAVCPAVAGAAPVAQLKSRYSPMTFVVARGEANSCGPGCDTWIAAEGDFDEGAAARFRTFLSERADSGNLPIFFHSRGGLVAQAFLIGDALNARRMTAGVGRAQRLDCRGRNARLCDGFKKGERRARLRTDALCASACVYAVVGAARRKIAADASVRVHAPRPLKKITPVQRELMVSTIDRYLTRAGVSNELTKLTMSVPSHSMRTLTRRKIIRFGIERGEPLIRDERPKFGIERDQVPMPTREIIAWRAEGSGAFGYASIKFMRGAWSGFGAMDIEIRLSCSGETLELGYRGAWSDTRDTDIVLTIGSEAIRLTPRPLVSVTTDMRSALLTADALIALAGTGDIVIARDRNPDLHSTVSRAGLFTALGPVLQNCPYRAVRG